MTDRQVRQRLDLAPRPPRTSLALGALQVLAVVLVAWGWSVVFLGWTP